MRWHVSARVGSTAMRSDALVQSETPRSSGFAGKNQVPERSAAAGCSDLLRQTTTRHAQGVGYGYTSTFAGQW